MNDRKSEPLVLVACSDDRLRWRLERWLLENDFRCEVFESCARLLSRLLQGKPDLVIVDWDTEGMPASHLQAVITRDMPDLAVIWLCGAESDPSRYPHQSLVSKVLLKPVDRKTVVELAMAVVSEPSLRFEACCQGVC